MEIQSVAVIGGGPAGLATVFELLHTNINGSTGEAKNSRFNKIVGFEQSTALGGVWNTSVEKADQISEAVLKSGHHHKPQVIQPSLSHPIELSLTEHTLSNPLIQSIHDNISLDSHWIRSAVYPDLYTNNPRKFLRFSNIEYEEGVKNQRFDPLLSYKEVTEVLHKFAKDHDLNKYFRLNTTVESVDQDEHTKKWVLTLRKTYDSSYEWYKEEFDAVVVATGHYQTPYIPYISGLYTRDHNSVIHAKSFRLAEDFTDQNVLIVGSSLSGIDIIQYIDSYAKSIVISRSPNKDEAFPWLTKVAASYPNKPRIIKIDNKTVYFEDGSELEDVDKIIFATGYHWYFPFLKDEYLQISKNGYDNSPTNSSRLNGLYYDTFSIKYPTLAFVGIASTSLQFYAIEVGAIAIAGVWSGNSTLVSIKDQEKWENDRLLKMGDNSSFHIYSYLSIRDEWAINLLKLASKGRNVLLTDEDLQYMKLAVDHTEELFYKIRGR